MSEHFDKAFFNSAMLELARLRESNARLLEALKAAKRYANFDQSMETYDMVFGAIAAEGEK